MNLKDLWKQKTTWAGAALIVTGIGQIVAEGDTSQGVATILTGLGMIFLRQAVAKTS